jgi:monoamine oxidase
MGTLHRTYFIFKKAFWPKHVHTFFHIAERGSAWPAFINMQFYNGQPALLAFHGGNAGRRLDAMTDAEIGGEGIRVLRKLFGENIPAPTQVIASHWGQDSLSRGTYSFIPVGATPSDYDVMAEPVAGKLYFAGEATNRRDPSTVHGAYLSGKREARRILHEHYR